jgi:hypothetical protein
VAVDDYAVSETISLFLYIVSKLQVPGGVVLVQQFGSFFFTDRSP